MYLWFINISPLHDITVWSLESKDYNYSMKEAERNLSIYRKIYPYAILRQC